VSDQFPWVTKSGEKIWLQATCGPVKGPDVCVVKVAIDVSERRRDVEGIGQGLDELAAGNLQYRVGLSRVPDIQRLGQGVQPVFDVALRHNQFSQTGVFGGRAHIERDVSIGK